MAETKKRAAPKRGKPTTRKAKATGTRANSTESKPAAAANQAKRSVENKAKSAGQTVGKAASKAKIPLVASGAALAGAAGGMALASRSDRHRRLAAAVRKPRISLNSGDVAKAAKEVGNFSAQVGELAAELQRAREVANGARHRSPVEVVLQGLTARR